MWVGEVYNLILQQVGFQYYNQKELLNAAAGRVMAAIKREQYHLDDMEKSHQTILGGVLCSIVYHRIDM